MRKNAVIEVGEDRWSEPEEGIFTLEVGSGSSVTALRITDADAREIVRVLQAR